MIKMKNLKVKCDFKGENTLFRFSYFLFHHHQIISNSSNNKNAKIDNVGAYIIFCTFSSLLPF